MRHFIIMSSSYSKGCRIALDFCLGSEKANEANCAVTKIKAECGSSVSISTHSIIADSEKWCSVVEADRFFEDVMLVDSIDEFIKLIKKDRVLTGWDVAKYILSKVKCTHLKLEKLVYLSYADYMCKTRGKKLFDDDIVAYKYGPIVQSVYDLCRGFGYEEVDPDFCEAIFDVEEYREMPIRSRILFAEDGFGKCLSIDKTINKYGRMSGNALVALTHKAGAPWARTQQSQIIKDSDILKYHDTEC